MSKENYLNWKKGITENPVGDFFVGGQSGLGLASGVLLGVLDTAFGVTTEPTSYKESGELKAGTIVTDKPSGIDVIALLATGLLLRGGGKLVAKARSNPALGTIGGLIVKPISTRKTLFNKLKTNPNWTKLKQDKAQLRLKKAELKNETLGVDKQRIQSEIDTLNNAVKASENALGSWFKTKQAAKGLAGVADAAVIGFAAVSGAVTTGASISDTFMNLLQKDVDEAGLDLTTLNDDELALVFFGGDAGLNLVSASRNSDPANIFGGIRDMINKTQLDETEIRENLEILLPVFANDGKVEEISYAYTLLTGMDEANNSGYSLNFFDILTTALGGVPTTKPKAEAFSGFFDYNELLGEAYANYSLKNNGQEYKPKSYNEIYIPDELLDIIVEENGGYSVNNYEKISEAAVLYQTAALGEKNTGLKSVLLTDANNTIVRDDKGKPVYQLVNAQEYETQFRIWRSRNTDLVLANQEQATAMFNKEFISSASEGIKTSSPAAYLLGLNISQTNPTFNIANAVYNPENKTLIDSATGAVLDASTFTESDIDAVKSMQTGQTDFTVESLVTGMGGVPFSSDVFGAGDEDNARYELVDLMDKYLIDGLPADKITEFTQLLATDRVNGANKVKQYFLENYIKPFYGAEIYNQLGTTNTTLLDYINPYLGIVAKEYGISQSEIKWNDPVINKLFAEDADGKKILTKPSDLYKTIKQQDGYGFSAAAINNAEQVFGIFD
jgi:hypothetical protein